MAYKNIQIKRALLFVAFVILMTIWLLILGFHKDPYIQSTLGALSVASSENEYFISVSGNDTNTGSIDSPFLTLSHALDYANPGDTVWVRGGDFKSHSYAGKVTISGKNGTEANPILVKAYNNEVPIFEYIKIQNSSWLELKGLTIIGAKTLPQEFQQIDHIYADDESVGIILGQENATTRQQKCAQKFPSYLDTVDYWLNNWSAGISIHTSHDILVSDNDVSYHSAGVQVRLSHCC